MMYAYNPTYKTKFALCVENNFMTFTIRIEGYKFFTQWSLWISSEMGLERNAF